MLGKKRGGLEQASLDYAEALAAANISALTIISPAAWVEAPMVAAGVPHQSLPNMARWDMLAAWRLRRIAKRTNATAIICHGNRALTLALLAFRFFNGSGLSADATLAPLKAGSPSSPQPRTTHHAPRIIAVAHNYQIRRFAKADGCLAITQHLADHLAAHGAKNIQRMPNMVRIPHVVPHGHFREPPVIGSMGRFVQKKRFDLYVQALAILKERGVKFRAILGGDGEKADSIRALIKNCELENHVTMSGWVRDKAEFFADIDIFALPSQHEPFGLVLIEAMAYGVPVVTTDAEGPREIVHDGVDALLTPRGDAQAMADALEKLIKNEQKARVMAAAAQVMVTRDYSLAAMAERLKTALAHLI